MRRTTARRLPSTAVQGLKVVPVTQLPERIAVGGGGALFVDGRCSHATGPIAKLVVTLESGEDAAVHRLEHPAIGWHMPPGDLGGEDDYWWAVVPLPVVHAPRLIRVGLHAHMRDGSRASRQLGTVELVPRLEPSDLGLSSPAEAHPQGVHAAASASDSPLVVVCMATYNPRADLLLRQIESIRAQTHDNWICVVSDGGSNAEAIQALINAVGDDERFHLSVFGRRLGIYHNFERALLMVPAHADYVALCDQDDSWHEEKLAALLHSLEPGTRLAYSDARLIDSIGQVIDHTLWRAGAIDHADFASLMLTTSGNIPGAAMLFEASLLEDVLPFPPSYRGMFHDFWIARVALALGKVSYVHSPLYDYVQHDQQTLGASAAPTLTRGPVARLIHRIAGIRAHGIHPGWRRSLYFDDYLRVVLSARALEARCAGRMSKRDRKTLRAIADSPRGIAWLVVRSIRASFSATTTRGAERNLLAALAWRHGAMWRRRLAEWTSSRIQLRRTSSTRAR